MEIRFNLAKNERKALVLAISELTGCGAVYMGAPGFAYAVNNYTVDKNGALIYDERTESGEVRVLLTGLAERGFAFEGGIDEHAPDTAADSGKLAVEIPLEGFTETTLANLDKLIVGKSALVMKALGADALPVERTESTLPFPWFPLSACVG